MLSTACQQGHLEVVRLLVHSYNADAEDCAIRSDEFAVITGLPLYAAARAGRAQHAICRLLIAFKNTSGTFISLYYYYKPA